MLCNSIEIGIIGHYIIQHIQTCKVVNTWTVRYHRQLRMEEQDGALVASIHRKWRLVASMGGRVVEDLIQVSDHNCTPK